MSGAVLAAATELARPGVPPTAELADQFIDWLVSVPAQQLIAEFGVAEFGAPLFTPDSAAWRARN